MCPPALRFDISDAPPCELAQQVVRDHSLRPRAPSCGGNRLQFGALNDLLVWAPHSADKEGSEADCAGALSLSTVKSPSSTAAALRAPPSVAPIVVDGLSWQGARRLQPKSNTPTQSLSASVTRTPGSQPIALQHRVAQQQSVSQRHAVPMRSTAHLSECVSRHALRVRTSNMSAAFQLDARPLLLFSASGTIVASSQLTLSASPSRGYRYARRSSSGYAC